LARAVVTTLALAGVLAGCGGGQKSYTYNFVDTSNSPLARGVYLTVVSPIKLPASAFKGARMVDHVVGPEACSTTETVKNPPKKYAQFAGKKLTLKVYGKNSFTTLICGVIRKSTLQPFGP
jgi:hypothetical protein